MLPGRLQPGIGTNNTIGFPSPLILSWNQAALNSQACSSHVGPLQGLSGMPLFGTPLLTYLNCLE